MAFGGVGDWEATQCSVYYGILEFHKVISEQSKIEHIVPSSPGVSLAYSLVEQHQDVN